MSSLTSLYGGGGGGTPVNSIARLGVDETTYTDPDGGVWLKTGNTITSDTTTYPDAYVNPANITSASDTGDTVNVSAVDGSPRGLFVFPNGSGFAWAGFSTQRIRGWNMATPFVLAGSSNSQASASLGYGPEDVTFNNNGTKMFVIGAGALWEYTCSIAYNVSTASLVSNYGVSNPSGLSFNPDGTKLFITSSSLDDIRMYNLSTAFDPSTLSYSGDSFSLSSQGTNPQTHSWNADGTKLFVSDLVDKVFQYNLSTAYDITTASYSDKFLETPNNLVGVYFETGSNNLYTINNSTDLVYRYNLQSLPFMGVSENTGTYDYVKLK